MIDQRTAERFMAAIHKHAARVDLDLLFDLVRALELTFTVKVIDGNEKEHGTNP